MSLQIGDQVPEFEAKDQNGNIVRLADFKGKKVVLYFYPKDDTPGCTAEACNLRDHYEEFRKEGYEVVGVSSDDEKSHRKFIDKHSLPFILIADTEKKLHEIFGTWGEKSMYGRKFMGTLRKTFVLDEEGKIAQVIEKVKTKDHAAQLLKG